VSKSNKKRLLKAGKLPAELLAKSLASIKESSPRVLLGPGVGEDAAFISFGSKTLIAKSDPVTFATDRIGWYAIQVNANDIAASGGIPRWFLATALLPEGAPKSLATEIFDQINDAANKLNIELIGGHTEITVDLPRPIIVGMMLGEAAPSETVASRGASGGDKLILTQGISIEGTSILAREAASELKNLGVSKSVIESAANFLDDPGISVLKAAQTAVRTGVVTAMHDPTEGGLSGAIDELCKASNTGAVVNPDAVHIFEETHHICNALGLDPWGLIASGALLIASSDPEPVLDALKREEIPAAVIGELTAQSGIIGLDTGTTPSEFPKFERDEIARYFGE
jgi:hydrogenase expression/formation protein HypE